MATANKLLPSVILIDDQTVTSESKAVVSPVEPEEVVQVEEDKEKEASASGEEAAVKSVKRPRLKDDLMIETTAEPSSTIDDTTKKHEDHVDAADADGDAAAISQNYPYYSSTTGQPSQTREPNEPYYVYDHLTGAYEPEIRQPSDDAVASGSTTALPNASEEYVGYNPKIHGNYDPTAPYATFHKRKREEEAAIEAYTRNPLAAAADAYVVAGAFNRGTGQFQTAELSAEMHDDYHKSGRQMGAFFDVDAAANSHGGVSLKEERRNQKLSAKQLRELKEKQKAKKEEKKRKWLMS